MKDEWKKKKRKVAQMFGSQAQEAFCFQRNRMLQEHEVLLQAREREKEFLESQMHSKVHSHIVSYRRVLHEREVQQGHIIKVSKTWNAQ